MKDNSPANKAYGYQKTNNNNIKKKTNEPNSSGNILSKLITNKSTNKLSTAYNSPTRIILPELPNGEKKRIVKGPSLSTDFNTTFNSKNLIQKINQSGFITPAGDNARTPVKLKTTSSVKLTGIIKKPPMPTKVK
jgi:hypothetical protein